MNKWLRYLVAVGFIVVVGTLAYRFFTSSQMLTVRVPSVPGLQLALYKTPSGASLDDVQDYVRDQNLVKRITGSSTAIKLKKGSYVIDVSGNNDYERVTSVLKLDNEPITYEPKLGYSASKLTTLVNQEKTSINRVITQSLPNHQRYILGEGIMHSSGEWYGTTVREKQTDEERRTSFIDIYRVVLHKENGTWKIATKLELALSRITYPKAPADFLTTVNNLP